VTSLIRPETSTYRLLKCLGEGLSSCVYAAIREDSRKFSKQSVVLKILKNETDVSWLKREFEALSSIRSPHCVGIYGWENLPEGPALVLEHIDGLTLRELIQVRDFTEEEIDEVISQIQLGLAAVHCADLCHGDISPSNVMIDRTGTVKLIDFALEPDAKNLIGTPAYLAPELWKGEKRSFASDLFSVGLLRFDLQCGLRNIPDTQAQCRRRAEKCEGSTLLARSPNERMLLLLESKSEIKDRLGKLVSRTLDERSQLRSRTQLLNEQTKQFLSRWCGSRVAVALIFSIVMLPAQSKDWSNDRRVSTAELEIRSHQWLEVFIDGKSIGYTPIRIPGINAGEHELKWRSAHGFGVKYLHFAPREVKRLRAEDLGL
jgi:serine/threonine protein kinase